MVQTIWRYIKRFLVLLPGLLIAILSVRNIFPYFDRRVPIGVAIILTYILAAYILIPASIRIIRIIVPARHAPRYCVTPDGFASDPLNLGLQGTREALESAMQAAGWFKAERHNIKNISRQIVSIILGRTYPTAPVSNLYLFGRKQDVAFEMKTAKVGRGNRHHVRFWALTSDEAKLLSTGTPDVRLNLSKQFWAGAASLDIGFAPIRHNLQITHMIHPDTNAERDLIVRQLKESNRIARIDSLSLGQPYRLVNRALRGYLNSDGIMVVIELREGS